MSEIIIRPIVKADAEGFFQLRLQALKTNPESFGADYEATLADHTVESYAERIPEPQSDNLIIGAEVDEQLVGMMGFVRETRLKTKHTGFIWGVFVAPNMRGKRIGWQMMDAMMTHIKQLQGLHKVTLSVVTTNVAAVALYRRFGFTTWGTEPRALKVGAIYYDLHYMSYSNNR